MAEPGHEIVTGTIGMGKSFWVLYKIIKSLENDTPCCYIDPKGDTYRNLLAFFCTPYGRQIWQAKRHRIRLLNPVAKSGHILGFNAIGSFGEFKSHTVDPIALIANSITAHIRRQTGYDTFDAMRMQEIMSAAIGLLVAEGLTLSELPLLFMPSFHWEGKKRVADSLNHMVRTILPKVSHLGTRTFWETDYGYWPANIRQEWPQSTRNKIFQYLFDERMLYTVCTSSGLDFRELVDERQWLFVNVPYQLMSDTLSTLLGNLIVSKIFYACLQRPPGAPDYRIILDEARFFNSGPLDQILETARAYRLWLTLVVQSLNQMARRPGGNVDEHLKETALNNARYFSVFGNNDLEDSATFARMMFSLTGTVVTGQRSSGDAIYLPVPAEEEMYRRRFTNLRVRDVVLYDQLNPRPRVWRTPQVDLPKVEESQLDLLETEHLQLTGISSKEARSEVETRYRYWQGLVAQTRPGQSAKNPQMGGSL